MNPQDASPHEQDPEAASARSQALARRSALLKGLRAGGVAVGGGASLNAFAARVVTSNGTQCTVSGQGSAAVSNPANSSASAPCGGFRPSHFFGADPAYEAKNQTEYSVSVGAAKLQVTNTFVAVQGVSSNGKAGTKLTPNGWPPNTWGGASLAQSQVNQIFGGSDTTPLLYALFRNDDLAFFVAAYFSAALPKPASYTQLPFSPAEVASFYDSATGSLDPNAVSLYRLVCVAP